MRPAPALAVVFGVVAIPAVLICAGIGLIYGLRAGLAAAALAYAILLTGFVFGVARAAATNGDRQLEAELDEVVGEVLTIEAAAWWAARGIYNRHAARCELRSLDIVSHAHDATTLDEARREVLAQAGGPR